MRHIAPRTSSRILRIRLPHKENSENDTHIHARIAIAVALTSTGCAIAPVANPGYSLVDIRSATLPLPLQ